MRARIRSLIPASAVCMVPCLLILLALTAAAKDESKTQSQHRQQNSDPVPGEILRADGTLLLEGLATPKFAVVERFFDHAWIAALSDSPATYDFYLRGLGITEIPDAIEVLNRSTVEYSEVQDLTSDRRWEVAEIARVYANFLRALGAIQPGLADRADAFVESEFRAGGSYVLLEPGEGRSEIVELANIFRLEVERILPKGKVKNLARGDVQ